MKYNKISILESAYVLFGYISHIYAKNQPNRASRFYVIENTDGHQLLIYYCDREFVIKRIPVWKTASEKRYCRNDVLEKIEPNQYPNAYFENN